MDDQQPVLQTEEQPVTAVETTPEQPEAPIEPAPSEVDTASEQSFTEQPVAASEPTPPPNPVPAVEPSTAHTNIPETPPIAAQEQAIPEAPVANTTFPEPPIQVPTPVAPIKEPDATNITTAPPVDRVAGLSDDELRLAAKLYAQKISREMLKKAQARRTEIRTERELAVLKLVAQKGSASIPNLANELNISPRLVAASLRRLGEAHKIAASGNSKARRYRAV